MSRWEAWSFNTLNALVALTGGVYFWMKYLLETDDPFALVNHPWQSAMLAGHVVLAPLLLMLFGVVLRSHVLKKLASNARPARRSGWTSFLLFAAMAVTGYLLQVVADPAWLRLLVAAHVGSSALFVAGYGVHLLVGRRLAARWPAAGTAPGEAALTP